MTKALVLLSGGLDSMLAARLLMEQGIEVTGLSFKSNFFGTAKAKKVADQLGIELIEADFSAEHLAMVKNPAHGYGKNMNPCIDCHALMFSQAKKIMERDGYDFVATGEVLGERPMSQNKNSLELVAKIAGLAGLLVRPLSAKLLPETEAEKQGKADRNKLLAISGRSRARQLELVKKFGIKEYASPGGGCLLTDPAYGKRLMAMLKHWPDCDGKDVELLKYGRTFWLNAGQSGFGRNNAEEINKALAVVGRDEQDNQSIEKLARRGDIILELKDMTGPLTLVRISKSQFPNPNFQIPSAVIIDVPVELKKSELRPDQKKTDEEMLNLALRLTGYYSTKARGKKVKVEVRGKLGD